MVKQPSSVEGVFLVGPAGGKLRPWCGKCHKFLKSETAVHDCTPVDFSKVRAKKGSGGTSKRNPRLTPKKIKILAAYLDYASVSKVMASQMKRLRNAKTKQAKLRAIESFNEAFDKAASGKMFAKAYNTMYHHFVK